MATVGETINETFQGGFFHALNPWSIPDWAFIGILVITVVGFVVGAEKFGKMLEGGKDEDYREGAKRLGYVKGDPENNGS